MWYAFVIVSFIEEIKCILLRPSSGRHGVFVFKVNFKTYKYLQLFSRQKVDELRF